MHLGPVRDAGERIRRRVDPYGMAPRLQSRDGALKCAGDAAHHRPIHFREQRDTHRPASSPLQPAPASSTGAAIVCNAVTRITAATASITKWLPVKTTANTIP